MKYVIELLESKLRDEILCQNDALNYFLGNHAYDNKIGSEATSWAFGESQRIAEERIPQLQEAIKKLKDSPLPEPPKQ